MNDKQYRSQATVHGLDAIPPAALDRAVVALRLNCGENGMKSPAQGKPMPLALLRAHCR